MEGDHTNISTQGRGRLFILTKGQKPSLALGFFRCALYVTRQYDFFYVLTGSFHDS